MGILLLGGVKHCGKTTLGRIVAKNHGCRFFDMDRLILQESGETWDAVRDIWNALGKDGFQTMETAAARTFSDRHSPGKPETDAVLSLGGGTIENPAAMRHLQNHGFAVYIRADVELLYSRIMEAGRPPFLSVETPKEDFMRLYQRRDTLYSDWADLIHTVDKAPPDVNARKLLKAMESHNVW